MTGLDIFIIVILAATAIWGYTRGLIMQMGSLLSFAIALAACHIFGDAATQAVTAMTGAAPSDPSQSSMTEFAASCIGHVTLFIIVWTGVWIAARAVKFVARSLRLGILDSLAGALFMALKAGVIISFVLNFAHFMAPASTLGSCGSTLTASVMKLAPALLGFLKPLNC